MRFLANGPSLPDELLVARDEGRVIFFCGAGISKSRANLPDFYELAKKIVEDLGVEDDDPARKVLDEARKIESRTGVCGLISADKVFSLLEHNFLSQDIEACIMLKQSKR